MKKNNTKIQFLWEGKEEALQECNTPPKIKYEIPKTVDGNEIHCVDNLDFLKNNLERLNGKVKCIYIDPPYNTGNDFIYKDKIHARGECKHSKWLSFMYPRLMVARELLQEDGVIFISIDDNEVHHLRLLMNEVFGEGENLGQFIWFYEGVNDNQDIIKKTHEYILCYTKNYELFKENTNAHDINVELNEDIENSVVKNGVANPPSIITLPVGFPSELEQGILKKESINCIEYLDDVIIENFKLKNSVRVKSGWSSKRILELFISSNFESVIDTKNQLTKFLIKKNGNINYIKDRNQSYLISVLRNYGTTQQASKFLESIGLQNCFSFPKPVSLIKHLLQISTAPNDLILDFFAGSGTTGQAVMELNQEEIDKQEKDGLLADKTTEVGGRKFILVQLPEKIDEKKEAFKAGYKKISDITIERVRRAGEKYKSVDVNFQIFGYDKKNEKSS